MGWWIPGLLAIWALAVAVCDVTRRRVPNALLILLAVPALLSLAVDHHGLLGVGVADSLAGFAVGTVPLLVGYWMGRVGMRLVGAGDVKLSGLQGFILGGAGSGKALLISGLVLGLMSAWALVRLKFAESAPSVRLPAAVALVVGFVVVPLVDRLA
jgi:Flp pilus assembly protein protease CpaA